MEIWSSPAAYDELNGNGERGGGGADPIARELEEGEGSPDPGPARGGRRRGPGSLLGRSGAGAGADAERAGGTRGPAPAPLSALHPAGAAAWSLGDPQGHPDPREDCPCSAGGGESGEGWGEGCPRAVCGAGGLPVPGLHSAGSGPPRGGVCVYVSASAAAPVSPRACCCNDAHALITSN